MNIITAAMENIATSLIGDSTLQAFCTSSWGKRLTAVTGYRKRSEIHIADLPLVRIVRPSGEEDPDGLKRSDIRLYIGFMQDDREWAPSEAILFCEHIRRVLRQDRRRGGNTQNTLFGPMVTDEGYGHPAYFSIMSLSLPLYGGQATPTEDVGGLIDELGRFLGDETGEIITW